MHDIESEYGFVGVKSNLFFVLHNHVWRLDRNLKDRCRRGQLTSPGHSHAYYLCFHSHNVMRGNTVWGSCGVTLAQVPLSLLFHMLRDVSSSAQDELQRHRARQRVPCQTTPVTLPPGRPRSPGRRAKIHHAKQMLSSMQEMFVEANS